MMGNLYLVPQTSHPALTLILFLVLLAAVLVFAAAVLGATTTTCVHDARHRWCLKVAYAAVCVGAITTAAMGLPL